MAPKCETTQVHTCNLTDLPIRSLDADPVAPGTNQFETIMPVTGKKVIIKGCASVTIPTWAYLILTAQIAQVADKIYYGEARYAVKIFN